MRSFRVTERVIVYDGGHDSKGRLNAHIEDGRQITVRAETIEQAAQHGVNRLVSRRAIAYRQTGEIGMSGIWQAYRACKTGGLTSTGPNIHVVEL